MEHYHVCKHCTKAKDWRSIQIRVLSGLQRNQLRKDPNKMWQERSLFSKNPILKHPSHFLVVLLVVFGALSCAKRSETQPKISNSGDAPDLSIIEDIHRVHVSPFHQPRRAINLYNFRVGTVLAMATAETGVSLETSAIDHLRDWRVSYYRDNVSWYQVLSVLLDTNGYRLVELSPSRYVIELKNKPDSEGYVWDHTHIRAAQDRREERLSKAFDRVADRLMIFQGRESTSLEYAEHYMNTAIDYMDEFGMDIHEVIDLLARAGVEPPADSAWTALRADKREDMKMWAQIEQLGIRQAIEVRTSVTVTNTVIDF